MEAPKKRRQNRAEKTKKYLQDYARYSTLAFKLIAVVLVGFFGGMKIDQWLDMKSPVFTLVLACAGLFLSIYLLIKDLLK